MTEQEKLTPQLTADGSFTFFFLGIWRIIS